MNWETVWSGYWFASFFVTFYLALEVDTPMSKFDNVTGSFMIGILGFILWPFILWAYCKQCKRVDLKEQVFEALNNALDNAGSEFLTMPSDVIAEELGEYTTGFEEVPLNKLKTIVYDWKLEREIANGH